MTLPSDFDSEVEARTNAVYSAWPVFCRCARTGFAAKQRGTFLIDLDLPFDNAGDTPYLTVDELSETLGLHDVRDIAITSRVGTYNPENEIVVTFKSAAHSRAQCIVLRLPPEEFRSIGIVTDRPNPRAATTFDELIDILNDLYFRTDVEHMDAPSRHVWRVMEAYWEVLSNGFHGYFYRGAICCELLDALNAIASPALLKGFSGAFARFPNGRPSTDDNEFESQLARITDANPGAFEENDSELDEIEDQIPGILWTYWQGQQSSTT